jgi:hypothetical protein
LKRKEKGDEMEFFRVRFGRERMEYADIEVRADSLEEAQEKAIEELSKTDQTWTTGDDTTEAEIVSVFDKKWRQLV